MLFSIAQAQVIASILRDAANAEILPRFRNPEGIRSRQKSSALDLVTDADEAAEVHIADALRRAFPSATIIGEESTARDPSLLRHLEAADLAILIDPIDGTKNFSAGLPLFGVMAAAVHKGSVIAGVIYDPFSDDWAIGLRGEGAWLERSDGSSTDLRVSKAPELHEATGIVSWLFMKEPLRSKVTRNLSRVAAAVDYRCAAHEYRMIAGGHYDFLMFGSLMPWDHAAGCLIHEEAGGYSAKLDGSAYKPIDVSGGLLCAPDAECWNTLRDAITGES